ncbi:uncharacterized protein LOC119675131 [Teleopsis dalmanni]|uniref:uncharacterized protein LOC119675131 n=1 Tax=Teleopsis dalmanni TaxID=139649 RepID=UPI0018CECE0F|nr:uncharacterized protein LOC119675131 [Teleopsis dalmanni]
MYEFLKNTKKFENRFAIKHPFEYISVDDLKFFRRKRPPDLHTKSGICLFNIDEPPISFGSLKTEYRKNFEHFQLTDRPGLSRRATSLYLEGFMHHKSEHQEQYHWFKPEDWQSCRSYPIRMPENLQVGGVTNMDPEHRSSYITYPMVDRTAKILPREMFRIEADPIVKHSINTVNSQNKMSKMKDNKSFENENKNERTVEDEQQFYPQQHIEQTKRTITPSEYKRQYIQYPIEKAHSIPQITHIKMHGKFYGVPEYQDSFKMYANYSKSAPIKKIDNLNVSGAEDMKNVDFNVSQPEYREQYCNPPKNICKEKLLKTGDHLRPLGEFTKDVPEYHESFQDPQVKDIPERGKCREPYLRLKGKIEFNPEYRNTYLDFPRSRPITKKPTSSFRLPISNTITTVGTKTSMHSPKYKNKSNSPKHQISEDIDLKTDITFTPEYRRAHYNYQLRERTPAVVTGNSKKYIPPKYATKKYTTTSTIEGKDIQKKRSNRCRQTSLIDGHKLPNESNFFENVGVSVKNAAQFGRRASVLRNASNCRGNSTIIEGNPKYITKCPKSKYSPDNQDSFVVLNEPCKGSNWMKKSWYES